MGSVGLLQIDQHLIVDAVLVEPAHGGQILLVFVALEELLDSFFDGISNVFQAFFGRLLCLFRHIGTSIQILWMTRLNLRALSSI